MALLRLFLLTLIGTGRGEAVEESSLTVPLLSHTDQLEIWRPSFEGSLAMERRVISQTGMYLLSYCQMLIRFLKKSHGQLWSFI